jgi:hypothetical protein
MACDDQSNVLESQLSRTLYLPYFSSYFPHELPVTWCLFDMHASHYFYILSNLHNLLCVILQLHPKRLTPLLMRLINFHHLALQLLLSIMSQPPLDDRGC